MNELKVIFCPSKILNRYLVSSIDHGSFLVVLFEEDDISKRLFCIRLTSKIKKSESKKNNFLTYEPEPWNSLTATTYLKPYSYLNDFHFIELLSTEVNEISDKFTFNFQQSIEILKLCLGSQHLSTYQKQMIKEKLDLLIQENQILVLNSLQEEKTLE